MKVRMIFALLILSAVRPTWAQFNEDAVNSIVINETSEGGVSDWGDYDNDGDLDLVIGSFGFLFVELYINEGGTFTLSNPGIFSTNGGNIKWGDYDGDDDLDLLVTRSRSFSDDYLLKLYENKEGVFTDVTNEAGLPTSLSHFGSWGDFDGDDDLDLAVIATKDGKIKAVIYENNGGVFTDIDAALPEAEEGTVTWANFDESGDLELLVTGFNRTAFKTQSSIFKRVEGVFEDSGAGLSGVMYSSASAGDFDGDSDLDIILTGSANSLATHPAGVPKSFIYRNDDGAFTALSTGISNVIYGSSDWGDYDDDGDDDLIVTGLTNYLEGEAISKIYRSNGDGTFDAVEALFPSTIFGNAQWGDYDGDTDLDFVLIGQQYIYDDLPVRKIYANMLLPETSIDLATINENMPVGTVIGDLTTVPAGDYSYSLAVDVPDNTSFVVEGSQLLSNVIFDYESQSSYLLTIEASIDGEITHSQLLAIEINDLNEAPSFIQLDNLAVNRSVGNGGLVATLSANDPDADNEHEFALTSGEGDDFNSQFHIESNLLTVKSPGSLSAGGYSIRIKAVDQDDAAVEQAMVIDVIDDIPWTFVRNDLASEVLQAMTFSDADWADYDGDGDQDLLIVGTDESSQPVVRIYKNDLGTFVDAEASLPTVLAGAARWGKRTADGYADLLLTGSVGGVSQTDVYHYENGGWNKTANNFVDVGDLGSSYADWADYDQDGDLDVVLTGSTASSIKYSKIYRNDEGTYIDIEATLAVVSDGVVEWGDYDGDGDLDLALAGDGWFEFVGKVYRNDGGQFVDIEAGIAPVGVSSMQWGDYDNDGDLDLLLHGIDTDWVTHTYIYEYDGNSFVETELFLGFGTSYVDWADYDHDGDFDIIATGSLVESENITTRVFQNNDKAFSDLLMDLPGAILGQVQWINIDSDLDLDYLITGFNGSNVISELYLNQLLSNQAPADILLDNAHLKQSAGLQALVGSFSVVDPDEANAHTYSLATGEGDEHNDLFAVADNNLQALDATALPADTYTVRIMADDGHGGQIKKAFEITVEDDIAPVAVAKDIEVALAEDGTTTIDPSMVDNGSTDPAGGEVSFSLGQTAFSCDNIGQNVISFTTTDGAGNSSSIDFTVTIVDDAPPVLKVREAVIYLGNEGIATLSVVDIDNGSTDNCGIAFSLSQTNFACENLGENEVTVTGKDPAGNTVTAVVKVQVLDTIAPVVVGHDITVYLDGDGVAAVADIAIDFGTTDNCELDALYLDWPSDFIDCGQLGDHLVDLVGVDKSGNSTVKEITMTIADNQPPNLFTRSLTVTLDEGGQAEIAFDDVNDGSYDNCSTAEYTLSRTVFTCEDLGTTTIEFTGVDAYGNTSSQTVELTVEGTCNELLGAKDALAADVIVYPNPTTDFIMVRSANGSGFDNGEVYVYDLTGMPVVKQTVRAGEDEVKLSVMGLSKGVYHLIFKKYNSSDLSLRASFIKN
ncbi:FG-GAP-like repeat-containing protein [uncultured Imperialibacter sp.]|uniref:FG-GAP-like repeat-containing protein n=1 Tax=uncultured Imperialibacter sp. TaxID=1672639 RepID=UPI0030D78604|tara:strand:- start:29503 stop:33894 length:4392 start_codon:yes stop_codon:yes gene_type:complete